MAEIKKYTITEPYLKIDCGLGEAPFWETSRGTLRFVDIIKSKVHVIDVKKGPSSHRELASLPISIGTTADIEGNERDFAFGGKHGYGIFNRDTTEYRYIKRVWNEAEIDEGKDKRMRANDGAVDSRGRYWVGFMNDPLITAPKAEGVVFRLDPDASLHRMIEGVTIPNGITWSADDKTMYFADSPTKNIFAYDFDAETGSISNKRVFYQVQDENGVPDGHVIDEEGCMWTAVHGIGKVLRISPEGKLLAEISIPTRCPTCPAFVDEDLYITSAEEEMPDRFPESTKYNGSLFKINVGVKGLQLHRLKYNGDAI